MIRNARCCFTRGIRASPLAAFLSRRAQPYPTADPIIVTVAAGGPMATIARFVATQMPAAARPAGIVENARLGLHDRGKAVATAEPDGSTLDWGTLSVTAIAPALDNDRATTPRPSMVGMVAEFRMWWLSRTSCRETMAGSCLCQSPP